MSRLGQGEGSYTQNAQVLVAHEIGEYNMRKSQCTSLYVQRL